MKLFIFIIILCVSVFLFFSFNNKSSKSSEQVISPIRDIVEIYDYNNYIFEDSVTKYYKSVELDSRISQLFKDLFPKYSDYHKSQQLLTIFKNYGDVFFWGGTIRDIVNNVRPKDIDMMIDVRDNQQMRDICSSLDIDFNSLYRVDNKNTDSYKQIKFLYGIYDITMISRVSIESIENDVNSMYYDFKKKIIIDPTATGLTNCLNMRFRVVQSSFDDWINSIWDNKPTYGKALRIFKMFKNGYKLIEEGDKTMNNYRIWLKSRLNLLMKKNQYCEIPVIARECLCVCRGDVIDPKTLTILQKGKNDPNLRKILYQIKYFDESIFFAIVTYLSKIDPNLSKIDSELIEDRL
jgi:hypothetical protein